MFRAELDEIESRYADRLEILHVLSRDPSTSPTSAVESTARSWSAGWEACWPRRASMSGSCAGRWNW